MDTHRHTHTKKAEFKGSSQKVNNLMRRWAKNMKMCFTEEDTKMKICPTKYSKYDHLTEKSNQTSIKIVLYKAD